MRGIDRTNVLAAGIAVTNGTTVVLGRLDLEAAFGFSVHTITLGGAAGNLNLLQTNFENSMAAVTFNADAAANCANAPGTPLAIAANSSQVTATSATASTPFSRWLILSFTPSASGTLWLSASVRKFPS